MHNLGIDVSFAGMGLKVVDLKPPKLVCRSWRSVHRRDLRNKQSQRRCLPLPMGYKS